MPNVYGFLWCLCYILVQFPLYSRVQDWNVSQMHSYVARTIIHVSWLHSRITACHFARCQQQWVLLRDVGSCPPARFPNWCGTAKVKRTQCPQARAHLRIREVCKTSQGCHLQLDHPASSGQASSSSISTSASDRIHTGSVVMALREV